MAGAPDLSLVEAYDKAGVDRMLIFPQTGDLDALRAQIEPFAEEVLV